VLCLSGFSAMETRIGLFEESDLLGNDSDMFFRVVGHCKSG